MTDWTLRHWGLLALGVLASMACSSKSEDTNPSIAGDDGSITETTGEQGTTAGNGDGTVGGTSGTFGSSTFGGSGTFGSSGTFGNSGTFGSS